MAKKSAKKSAPKPAAKKAAKAPAKKSAKPAKKEVKKATKKDVKKDVKKNVKKETKAAKPAAKKPAPKVAPKAEKKAAGKAQKSNNKTTKSSGGSAGEKNKSTMARKSAGGASGKGDDAEKSPFARTAVKVPNRGILIRLKRTGAAPAPVAPAIEKTRDVATTERSKGSDPITLHHRKPTKPELEVLRGLLVARREQLMGDVKDLEEEAFSEETQHVSGNHLADGAFEQYEQEFNLSMIENETEELKEIARALEKLDRAEYGVCESCGIDISIERLHAMPYTRICIHCRTKYEEEGGGEQYGVLEERRV